MHSLRSEFVVEENREQDDLLVPIVDFRWRLRCAYADLPRKRTASTRREAQGLFAFPLPVAAGFAYGGGMNLKSAEVK